LVVLLFGPPGSGKGTQSRLITDWLRIPAISTGEMLRAEMQAGTQLGEQARVLITSGKLAGDELVNQMLLARISQPDCENGFLLDGYPRTVAQAEFLDGVVEDRDLPPAIILHLDVPSAALVARMSSRRQCPKCGRTYNILSAPPKRPGICDDDGTPLVVRKDDQIAIFEERLRTYDEMTRPVLAYYHDRNYFQISGDRSPKYIFEEITSILEPFVAQVRNGATRRG
jgi:adenylate kinase